MSGLAFLDTETTGLHPDRHQIWEVGLIVDNDEHLWQFSIDEITADPFALDIGHWWERRWSTTTSEIISYDAIYEAHTPKSRRKNFPHEGRAIQPDLAWCHHFRDLTAGRHLVGAVISFDEERLRRLLHSQGVLHRWHYHLCDVEALAAGFLRGRAAVLVDLDWTDLPGPQFLVDHPDDRAELHAAETSVPPWDSTKLSLAVGVAPDDFDRHTALGDARWAKAIYEAVMGPC